MCRCVCVCVCVCVRARSHTLAYVGMGASCIDEAMVLDGHADGKFNAGEYLRHGVALGLKYWAY